MKKGVPERGDVLHVDLDPIKGREERGKRYVVVLTPIEFNRFGIVLASPITQGGSFAREHGFAVALHGTGAIVQGVALCHQLRTIDFKERGVRWVESLPQAITEEILARARTLLD